MTTIRDCLYPWLAPTDFHRYGREPDRMHPVLPWWYVLDFRTDGSGQFAARRVDGVNHGGYLKSFAKIDLERPMERASLLGQIVLTDEWELRLVTDTLRGLTPIIYSPNGRIWAPPGWLPGGVHLCDSEKCPGRPAIHECRSV